MLGSRRVRTLAALGVLAVALGLATGLADPAAVAAPSTFTIVGGYGHGVGMSQYGAHGMALRRMGCDVGQGCYLGKPMEAGDMDRLVGDELTVARTVTSAS